MGQSEVGQMLINEGVESDARRWARATADGWSPSAVLVLVCAFCGEPLRST